MEQEKRVRPWRVIAKELTHEMDPAKVFALSQELNEALQEQLSPAPSMGRAPRQEETQ
jgi:hypothetical protein